MKTITVVAAETATYEQAVKVVAEGERLYQKVRNGKIVYFIKPEANAWTVFAIRSR